MWFVFSKAACENPAGTVVYDWVFQIVIEKPNRISVAQGCDANAA